MNADKTVIPELLHREWQRLEEVAALRRRLARIDAEIARLEARRRGDARW